MSNWLGWKFWCLSAFTGLDHQVTRAETAPPQAAAASRAQPILTASQRRRVMLCIQASWLVPVSNSRATSGPPQNTPSRHGTTTVSETRMNMTGEPRVRVLARLPQVWLAAHKADADWYCERQLRTGDQQEGRERGQGGGGHIGLVAVLAPDKPRHWSSPTEVRCPRSGVMSWPM